MGTLEEEYKKYLYPLDVEIKSAYEENMKLKELKEISEETLLRKRVGEERKKKKDEEVNKKSNCKILLISTIFQFFSAKINKSKSFFKYEIAIQNVETKKKFT